MPEMIHFFVMYKSNYTSFQKQCIHALNFYLHTDGTVISTLVERNVEINTLSKELTKIRAPHQLEYESDAFNTQLSCSKNFFGGLTGRINVSEYCLLNQICTHNLYKCMFMAQTWKKYHIAKLFRVFCTTVEFLHHPKVTFFRFSQLSSSSLVSCKIFASLSWEILWKNV